MKTINETPLQKVIEHYESCICGKWKPSSQFYKEVGINQKRFGMLIRGELPMYGYEAKNLATFFQVPVTDLF